MSDPQAAAIKKEIRNRLRKERVEYAASLPEEVSALVFHRPPAAVLDLVPDDAVIGFYRADPGEAPARCLRPGSSSSAGTPSPCPGSSMLQTPMDFPPAHRSLRRERSRQRLLRPDARQRERADGRARRAVHAACRLHRRRPPPRPGRRVLRPLARQPSGHIRFGLAWDMQEVPELPIEPHDMHLTAVITPTRLLGPF